MAKLEAFVNSSNEVEGYHFWCPGCQDYHAVTVAPYANSMGAKWQFNGNLDLPTFTPSIFLKVQVPSQADKNRICHCYVTDGEIRYLSDCSHQLAGQTIDLPDISEGY
jgi:hypothetical protein